MLTIRGSGVNTGAIIGQAVSGAVLLFFIFTHPALKRQERKSKIDRIVSSAL
jgi:hypothetical protein